MSALRLLSRSKRYAACSDAVVRVTGLEPARLAAREPKGDVTLVKGSGEVPFHHVRALFAIGLFHFTFLHHYNLISAAKQYLAPPNS